MNIFYRALMPVLLLVLLPFTAPAAPDNAPQTHEQVEAYLKEQVAKLHPQHGKVTLGDGLATLTLPEDFGYLTTEETEILIHNIWGNPPGAKTLGSIIPMKVNMASVDGWGVIITYADEGHVKDDETIDADKLLVQMKDANREESEHRRQEGYPAFSLLGWAEEPHYDKAAHKLTWAMKLQSDGSPEVGINYNIRILGREGFLVMSMVGSLKQLPLIETNRDKILSFVDFNATHRYADFNPDTDKVAAYGMAALVGGYALAKVGLFKGLLVALLAFKKFIILAAVTLAAYFRKLFKRK